MATPRLRPCTAPGLTHQHHGATGRLVSEHSPATGGERPEETRSADGWSTPGWPPTATSSTAEAGRGLGNRYCGSTLGPDPVLLRPEQRSTAGSGARRASSAEHQYIRRSHNRPIPAGPTALTSARSRDGRMSGAGCHRSLTVPKFALADWKRRVVIERNVGW